MYFSRVLSDGANDLSGKAKMHGIHHTMTQHEEDTNHIIFEFDNINEKKTFDQLAIGSGYEVDVHNDSMQIMDNVEAAINAVVKGNDPHQVIEAATVGMLNAYSKMAPVMKCSDDDCTVTIPKYVGRYPKLCPACGADLISVAQETRNSKKV